MRGNLQSTVIGNPLSRRQARDAPELAGHQDALAGSGSSLLTHTSNCPRSSWDGTEGVCSQFDERNQIAAE